MSDEDAAPKSAKGQGQLQGVLPKWTVAQSSLAAASGLSILLVDGPQPPALAIANNNSICKEFQTSAKYSHLCEPFCGEAYNRAIKAGAVSPYRCHAGLHCIAMPIALNQKTLAVIGGRAFVSTADFRELAERIRAGDLQDMLSNDLFKNVIFAAQQDLQELAGRVSALASEYQSQTVGNIPASSQKRSSLVPAKSLAVEPESIQELNAPFGDIDTSCEAAVRALAEKYKLESLALLLRTQGEFVAVLATGRLATQPVHLRVEPHDSRFFDAARSGDSIVMTETPVGIETAVVAGDSKRARSKRAIELFPLIIESEFKGALIIADASLEPETRKALSRFCRELALPLEVMRLRGELEKRARFADSLQTFTSGLSTSDPNETYSSILRHSADLLHAERSSLQLYDETSNELMVKVAFGARAKIAGAERMRLGDGVSGSVLLEGRPLVVRDLETSGCEPAPADRRYKTRSFISYPISIRGRKLGVLNITDKDDGSPYDEDDLDLIEILAPQIALALDRADWQVKAAQFQLISITDPLTGLLNRRYLEERLAEELKRSERENYQMSFLMIDIDDFKYYNDQNGHQAGDLALEMTAQCLKSVLRAADVASRYGGEEFCILLPQTRIDEATSIAERIRQRVERTRVPHGKSQPLGVVTVSIGVSAFNETLQTPASIIGAADRALYLAKHLGKNRVQVVGDNGTDLSTGDANERAN